VSLRLKNEVLICWAIMSPATLVILTPSGAFKIWKNSLQGEVVTENDVLAPILRESVSNSTKDARWVRM
jgi:hypothetical protein